MNKQIIDKFKKNRSLFQAIILKDGEIVDASEGFMYVLLNSVADKYEISPAMVADMCPYSDPMKVIGWLCITVDCICIDENAILTFGTSEAQLRSIVELKSEGLYNGNIPYDRCN